MPLTCERKKPLKIKYKTEKTKTEREKCSKLKDSTVPRNFPRSSAFTNRNLLKKEQNHKKRKIRSGKKKDRKKYIEMRSKK